MMKITKYKPGAMCLGGVRLLPIDVGFDLRVVRQAIRLPVDDDVMSTIGPTDQTGVGYEDCDGVPCLVHGIRDEIVQVLQQNGYSVA